MTEGTAATKISSASVDIIKESLHRQVSSAENRFLLMISGSP